MFKWTYSGVNASIPGNAGPDCASFLSPTAKLVESIVVLTFGAMLTSWGYNKISKPKIDSHAQNESCGKKILLVLTTLVWGIEIGFKLASESVIYLLNPCHITTAIQIYLLASSPSSRVTSMFRIHFNFLNGAVLAILFPVTDTRVLPFETTTYWLQHIMMLIVPYYLLRMGGVYNMENLTNMRWWAFSYGSNIFYHYIILQGIAIPTQVNLNHMLCPAKQDPFYGPYYRVLGVSHQLLLTPLTNKCYGVVNMFLSDKKVGSMEMKGELKAEEIVDALKGGGDKNECITVKNGHPHME